MILIFLQGDIVLSGLFLIVLALICEYLDSAMGGGYGTILVPVLIILGFEKNIVVPAVLFTEIWTGFSSALLHHIVGNANFNAKIHIFNGKQFLRFSTDFKISLILASFGVIGGAIAAIVALKVPGIYVKTYIGVLVIIVGFLVLKEIRWNFDWQKICGIGFLAAFNKGLSGGGYGPLISSGQVIINRNPREAVASTSLSEAVVCISALITYLILDSSNIDLSIMFFLLLGAMGSVPLAVLTVKRISVKKLIPLMGYITITLGTLTLIKTWFL